MALRLITDAAVEPITLEEAKAHLRVDHTDDDEWIARFIRASRRNAERFLSRALITQTWEMVIDSLPDVAPYAVKIPYPPLQSVVSIKYDGEDGVEVEYGVDSYDVDTVSEPGWVVPATTWPTTIEAINAVRIRFIAGYAPGTDSPVDLAANVPEDIKGGILLHLAHMYQNRETVSEKTLIIAPQAYEWLMRPYRIDIGMA